MVANSSVALPTGLLPASRRPAVLADEVLVPASGASMPDWLAYLHGRASGYADAWAETTFYRADEYVHYSQNIYRAIVDNEGIQPSSDADGGNVWTMVLDASLGPPREWLDTREVDARIVFLRPNPYTTADKNKVAGIENGATGDQTATEIIDLIEGQTGDERLNYESLRNLPRQRWRGPWQNGNTYQIADMVWHADHIWICRTNTLVSTVGPDGDTANWDPLSIYRGNWTDGWFEPGDIVRDSVDQNVYICIAQARNSGAPSSDTTRWSAISSSFRGQWQTGRRYHRGQMVYHRGHLWVCRTDNLVSIHAPPGQNDDWDPANVFRGAWEENVPYTAGEIAQDTSDGHFYICIADADYDRGRPSAETTLWRRITNLTDAEVDARIQALRPNPLTNALLAKVNGIEDAATADQTGPEIVALLEALTGTGRLDYSAIDGTPTDRFRGDWLYTNTYQRAEIVYHYNHLWICLSDNHISGSGPDSDTDNWNPISGYRGTWVTGWYERGDMVRDSEDGQYYVCTASVTNSGGRPSSAAANWTMFSNPFRGNWHGSVRYQRGNIAWHDSHLWICRTDNHRSGWGPNADTDNWDPLTLYRGDWTATWYEPGDMVTDTADNQIYLCVATASLSVGRPSSDATHWTRLSNPSDAEIEALVATWAKANSPTGEAPPERLGTGTRDGSHFLRDDGVWSDPEAANVATTGGGTVQASLDGLTRRGRYRGAYNSTYSYFAGDIVVHAGVMYIAYITGLNSGILMPTPAEGVSGWYRIVHTDHQYPPQIWYLGVLYPAGYVVRHNDGFWRANQETTAEPGPGVASWDAIIDGRASRPSDIDARIAGWAREGNADVVPDSKLPTIYVPDVWAREGNADLIPGVKLPYNDIDARIATWARTNEPSGTVPPATLGTGDRTGDKYLRDDGAWELPTLPTSQQILDALNDLTLTGTISRYRLPTEAFAWRGPWSATLTYFPGAVVLHNSALWIWSHDGYYSYNNEPGSASTPAWVQLTDIEHPVADWAVTGNTDLIPAAKIPPGPYRGDYSSTATYSPGDVIHFALGNHDIGRLYRFTGDSPSTTSIPPYSNLWEVIGAYQGQWQVSNYSAGSIVERNGELYLSTSDVGSAYTSPESGGTWKRISARSHAEIDGRIDSWARTGDGGVIPTGKLGSGTPDSAVFLRGDGQWAQPPMQAANDGGEANVQANWNETNASSDAYIRNKPDIGTIAANRIISGVYAWARNGDLSPIPASKLVNAPTSQGEANVQSNWNETNSASDAYIQNKPAVPGNAEIDARIAPWARTGEDAPTGTGEPNVQANWSETDANDDAFIQNKPSIPGNDEIDARIAIWARNGQDAPEGSGEVNVQADWDETDANSDAYIQNKPTLFSGAYDDLTGKPTIPAAQVNADWNATEGAAQILNKPTLWAVYGTPGDGQIPKWSTDNNRWEASDDEIGEPGTGEANVQSDWNVTDSESDAYIQNKPTLFSGAYNDLTGRPTIPPAQVSSDWNATQGVAQILNKPDLFIVAGTPTDGQVAKWSSANDRWEAADDEVGQPGTGEPNVQADWNETDSASDAYIQNKPTIPAGQVNSDWNAATGLAQILNKPVVPVERWKGNWASGVYEVGHVVKDNDGQIYFCIDATTDTDMTRPNSDAAHWLRLSVLSARELAVLLDGLAGNDRMQYSSLRGRPTIPAAQVSADWDATQGVAQILNKPTLFSGAYNDLTGRPTLFSGAYEDLTGKPTIPAAQVNSDWNATTGVAQVLNKPDLRIYRGAWDTGESYQQGQMVGHDSHVWLAVAAADADSAAPGTDGDTNWRRLDHLSTNEVNVIMAASVAAWAMAGNDSLIPAEKLPNQVQSDWNETDSDEASFIANKPTIPTIPAGVAATTQLGDWPLAFTVTGPVGDVSGTLASDHVYTIIPATGRIRISVNHALVRGTVEVPASCLREAQGDTARIGRLQGSGGRTGYVAFYVDSAGNNRLHIRQDGLGGMSNCRVVVQHIDDGLDL